MTRRTDRLNSLLREVLTEVIRADVKNPDVNEFTSVTHVDITKDLRHAKVYISIIGEPESRTQTVHALNQASGFISVKASKKVCMHHFPELIFKEDDSVDKHMRIEEILEEIKEDD